MMHWFHALETVVDDWDVKKCLLCLSDPLQYVSALMYRRLHVGKVAHPPNQQSC